MNKNLRNCPHSGKEPSPKGLGRCARNEDLGAVAEGTDNKMWVVVPDKNQRHYWRRIVVKGPVQKKECLQGKVRNPKTGRCVKEKVSPKTGSQKECLQGKVRNPKTGRCVKVKGSPKPRTLKQCLQGKVRNPKTGRCVKVKQFISLKF